MHLADFQNIPIRILEGEVGDHLVDDQLGGIHGL